MWWKRISRFSTLCHSVVQCGFYNRNFYFFAKISWKQLFHTENWFHGIIGKFMYAKNTVFGQNISSDQHFCKCFNFTKFLHSAKVPCMYSVWHLVRQFCVKFSDPLFSGCSEWIWPRQISNESLVYLVCCLRFSNFLVPYGLKQLKPSKTLTK